jgi:hypothetical protein
MTDEKSVGALTPAEVEILKQMIADKDTEQAASVQQAIDAAVAPLNSQVSALTQQVATMQESLHVLDSAAVKVGSKVALRGSSGTLMAAKNGGPTVEGKPFTLESRSTVGQWESFGVEKGQ